MTSRAAKLKALPELFRSDPVHGIAAGDNRIDREKGIIRGYSVARLGVTVDSRCELDGTTLDSIVELGNEAGSVKTRFGHPNMSDDGLGRHLGRSRNFRRDGDVVRADLHLAKSASKTPEGDLAGYVLGLAEEDPDAFGASMVVKWREEYRRNADGTRQLDAQGKALPPLMRIDRLAACDVVGDPAVKQGFFSGLADPAEAATALLDRHFDGAAPEVIRARLDDFLTRYLTQKGFAMSEAKDTKTPEQKPAETPTGAGAGNGAGAGSPSHAEALAAREAALAKREAEFAAREKREAEVQQIRDLCRAQGVKDAEAEKFCEAGLTLPDVKDRLLEQRRKEFALKEDPGTNDPPETSDPEAKAKAEFAAHQAKYDAMGVSEEEFLFSQRVEREGGSFAFHEKAARAAALAKK